MYRGCLLHVWIQTFQLYLPQQIIATTATPLNIRLGNKDLRNLHYYDVEANVTLKWRKMNKTINLSANYHRTDNQVAYALIFDKTTGAQLYILPVWMAIGIQSLK